MRDAACRPWYWYACTLLKKKNVNRTVLVSSHWGVMEHIRKLLRHVRTLVSLYVHKCPYLFPYMCTSVLTCLNRTVLVSSHWGVMEHIRRLLTHVRTLVSLQREREREREIYYMCTSVLTCLNRTVLVSSHWGVM